MSTQSHHQLARSAGVFTGATMLSRILGYARDTLVATLFGASGAADAFYAAFRISNLFRRMLGEGALSASFVPVFSEYAEKESQEATQEFLNVMFTLLSAILVTFTVLGIIFAPQITRVITSGFDVHSERFALTVTLTRYMFPFLMFVSLAALLTGVLNALRSFFLPALAPACLSIAEIGYILAIAPIAAASTQAVGLAIAVSVGGIGQFFLHVPALWAKGFRLRLRWDLHHPGVRRVGRLMIPATLGISVDQINAFVDTAVASHLIEGSITALYYSNRVMQLPLALFGVALSQVALPAMSASVARNDPQAVKETVNFALRLTLFMIVPAMTGLLLLGHPIVAVLFQHGRFDALATDMTNHALIFFSLGLFAYSAVKILASAFFAFQNTRVPVIVAAICVTLNLALNLAFITWTSTGVGGLACATAIASWVNAVLLYAMLRRKLGSLGGFKVLKTGAQALVASAGMALFSYAMMYRPLTIPLAFRLTAAIAGGAVIYLFIARALHMDEWEPFWAQLARRRAALTRTER